MRLFFTRLLLDCTLDGLLCALEGKGGTSKCIGETCWPIVEKQDLKNGRGQLYMVFRSVPGGLVVNICLFWGLELRSKPCGSGYVRYYRFLNLSLHLYTQNLSWVGMGYLRSPSSFQFSNPFCLLHKIPQVSLAFSCWSLLSHTLSFVWFQRHLSCQFLSINLHVFLWNFGSLFNFVANCLGYSLNL